MAEVSKPELVNDEIVLENERLKQKLAEYKDLEEEFVAQKVFNKAKRMIFAWVSIGGVALMVFGYTGVSSILSSVEETAKTQTESLVKASIDEIAAEVTTSTEVMVARLTDEIADQALLEAQNRLSEVTDETVKQLFQAEVSRRVEEKSDELERLIKTTAATLKLEIGKQATIQEERIAELSTEVESLRSGPSRVPSKIRFINNLDRAVDVIWIDFQGTEKLYNKLDPGQGYTQQTYMTHTWIARAEGETEPALVLVASKSSHTAKIER